MRFTIVLFACIALLCSCNKDESSIRDHNGRDHQENDYPVLPDGSNYTEKDKDEMKDTSVRFSCNGAVLKYGNPGILYTSTPDGDKLTLRDLSQNGHVASITLATRRVELDGIIIAYDAVKLQESEGTIWWRAYTATDSVPVYFVIETF